MQLFWCRSGLSLEQTTVCDAESSSKTQRIKQYAHLCTVDQIWCICDKGENDLPKCVGQYAEHATEISGESCQSFFFPFSLLCGPGQTKNFPLSVSTISMAIICLDLPPCPEGFVAEPNPGLSGQLWMKYFKSGLSGTMLQCRIMQIVT